ncbi:hypothetical protein R3P38DRAFT_1810209 [Favolaschia claudopus]|uniref:Uncharacterized protein n=1 Tax=Favolaschia claudopus TaxID=2862362 RepID=A0AAW0A4R6_9AGAR
MDLLCSDTPLRALYRLYECTVDYDANEMMLDSQYWFHQQAHWRLADVPDPKDPDPTRYAIIASLVEDLVDAFNYEIKLGLRRGITFETKAARTMQTHHLKALHYGRVVLVPSPNIWSSVPNARRHGLLRDAILKRIRTNYGIFSGH